MLIFLQFSIGTRVVVIDHRDIDCFTFIISERELTFTFAICYRRSVCLSVCRLFVTLVHPTQLVDIFGIFSPHDSSGTVVF